MARHHDGAGAATPPGTPPARDATHRLGRRRRYRRRRRLRLASLLLVGAVVAAAGAMIGLGGGYGLVVLLHEEPMSETERVAYEDFMTRCPASLENIDCACMWQDARAAFAPETQAAVLQLIRERRDLPVRLQRIRSEKLLGPDLARDVWDATYRCSRG